MMHMVFLLLLLCLLVVLVSAGLLRQLLLVQVAGMEAPLL